MKKSKVLPLDSKENLSLEQIKNSLANYNACYVLITCKKPSKEGEMAVEMCYEGDETLASYLVENAKEAFSSKIEGSQNSQ